MADYKTIHGTSIQNFSADPDNPIEGQIWYDETAATIQYQIPNKNTAGTWRTANALNTTRGGVQGGGTQTSAIVAGGGDGPPWGAGAGTKQNAESYDGTTWTEVADLGAARYAGMGTASSNTAAVVFGGFLSPPFANQYLADCETWNGSSWTEVADLNTTRRRLAAAGTQTAALGFGGYPPAQAVCESYDGSSWTEVSDLNTARSGLSAGGLQPAAVAFAGYTPGGVSALTELWDGSSWTETTDLNTAVYVSASFGTQAAALNTGGEAASVASATEEWTYGATATNWDVT